MEITSEALFVGAAALVVGWAIPNEIAKSENKNVIFFIIFWVLVIIKSKRERNCFVKWTVYKNYTTLKITNVLGQIVFSKTNANNQKVIDVSNLNSGLYILSINSDDAVEQFKFQKQ